MSVPLLAGESEGLRVVTRRVRYDATRTLLGCELEYSVHGAAVLEGPHLLQVLALKEEPPPRLRIQRRARQYRRAVDVRRDALTRSEHVGVRKCHARQGSDATTHSRPMPLLIRSFLRTSARDREG